MQTLDIILWLF